MDGGKWLVEQFERQRPHLRAVAYRMLGSLAEADDAVQETWLRLSQSDTQAIENLRAWLTTIIARVSLNKLRARNIRREEPMAAHLPDPVIRSAEGVDLEHPVLLADEVGLALLVVLDTLSPAERLAFVLHDMFSVSFDEIAPMVDRSPAATRKLASRARRLVEQRAPPPERDLGRQREIVDAFFAAAHDGDFERLVAVLDPEVVLRSDGGTQRPSVVIRGARAVAGRAVNFARLSAYRKAALVNGAAGVVVVTGDRPFAVMGFTVVGSRIVEVDVLSDPERLRRLDLSLLDSVKFDGRPAEKVDVRPASRNGARDALDVRVAKVEWDNHRERNDEGGR
jgi:RNA polymerase sigma-70 factor, ECF subfamily